MVTPPGARRKVTAEGGLGRAAPQKDSKMNPLIAATSVTASSKTMNTSQWTVAVSKFYSRGRKTNYPTGFAALT